MPKRVLIIGAGAAGMLAAAEAARFIVPKGGEVLLLEKNSKTGVKILMSGGTRCNLTQDTDARGIFSAFGHAQRFLQPSVGALPPTAIVKMFNQAGVPTKIESTGKVFPESDRAIHVRDALQTMAVDAGATILRGVAVRDVTPSSGEHRWNVVTDGNTFTADQVIVTAGGRSWPGCGTTGDAYAWLKRLGHTIVPTRPALVPLVGGTSWMNALSGLTIEDCVATVRPTGGSPKKFLSRRRSSLLFTHFGFSGPAPMDVSGAITAAHQPQDVCFEIDLLPDCSEDTLQNELSNRGSSGGRAHVSNVLSKHLPSRLADAIVVETGGDRLLAELPGKQRLQIVQSVKHLTPLITGTRGFDKAEVTAGGVSLAEVDSRTMQSKLHEGLFIAGEVLDVDGPIGGYNFSAAFATGRAAAIAAATLDVV
jgi:predicted Rossmann fold flavoprotein